MRDFAQSPVYHPQMRSFRVPACLAPVLVLACGGGPGDGFASGAGPGITSVSGTTGGSTTSEGGSSGSTSGESSSPGSTSGAADSTGAGSTSATTVYDLGAGVDLGSGKPPGCDDKIDFLFVMQRALQSPATQEKLIAAFPEFIDTIQERFSGFDVHIMVTDSDWQWGITDCNPQGCDKTNNNGCELDGNYFIPDYPCGVYPEIIKDPCNITLGAGVIFNAGEGATNAPCQLDDDRRYITQDQTNLKDTFACLARAGQSNAFRIAESAIAAVSPEMNAEGACNAGFLRDDALLMLTWVATADDTHSEGSTKEWAEAIFAAKHGNKNSVIMLGIGGVAETPPSTLILKWLKYFPLSLRTYIDEPSYGPGFAAAVELVDEACKGFVPPG